MYISLSKKFVSQGWETPEIFNLSPRIGAAAAFTMERCHRRWPPQIQDTTFSATDHGRGVDGPGRRGGHRGSYPCSMCAGIRWEILGGFKKGWACSNLMFWGRIDAQRKEILKSSNKNNIFIYIYIIIIHVFCYYYYFLYLI